VIVSLPGSMVIRWGHCGQGAHDFWVVRENRLNGGKVARLAATLPVAVDGGTTHRLARRCHDRGAGYLISVRDLFRVAATSHYPSLNRERRPA
jgi:pentose-5-phosphate-3-epimerase